MIPAVRCKTPAVIDCEMEKAALHDEDSEWMVRDNIMLTVGIHIGQFAIRISQSYRRPGDSCTRFNAVEWPSHAHTHWYACYGGALPNAYDPSSGKIGYEALDEVGLARVSRFDSDFFQRILDDGHSHEEACHLWDRFQQSLRRCPALRVREPATVALVLDGIEVSAPTSKWRPWHRSEDRTSDLVERLQALGRRAGLVRFEIVPDRMAVERYVSAQEGMQRGDLLAVVGASYTRVWEIVDPVGGALKPVCNTVGIQHLLAQLGKGEGSKEDMLRKLLEELQEPGRRLTDWRSLGRWQEERLFPYVAKAIGQLPHPTRPAPSRRLRVGGEGASLLHGFTAPSGGVQVDSWQFGHLYLPADGAAAAVCEPDTATNLKE